MRKNISSLADLPSHGVHPLGALAVPQLNEWARLAGHRFYQVDFASCTDKAAVLETLAQSLNLPKHFGNNWDALYDCLTDLPEQQPAPGYVLVLLNLPTTSAFNDVHHAALLNVFRDAADTFADLGCAWRVYYR